MLRKKLAEPFNMVWNGQPEGVPEKIGYWAMIVAQTTLAVGMLGFWIWLL